MPGSASAATSSGVEGYGPGGGWPGGPASRLPRDALQNPVMTCDPTRGDVRHASESRVWKGSRESAQKSSSHPAPVLFLTGERAHPCGGRRKVNLGVAVEDE